MGGGKGSRGNYRAKNKMNEIFWGSVKKTFDVMKNSATEFVKNHREKKN